MRLNRWIALAEIGAALVGVAGAAALLATLLVGRTALFFPSFAWALTYSAAAAVPLSLWWVASRLSPETARLERWRATAWPRLALLPAACASVALYVDEVSNHFTTFGAVRESLVVYVLVLYALAELLYFSHFSPWPLGSGRWRDPIVLAIGFAAYVNAAVYVPWPPLQVDLKINLDGARELLAGGMPYRSTVEQWGDRVHLLPATLVLLFGPLTLLGEPAARALFFVLNQAFWIAGLALLARWLAPPGAAALWLGALLAFSALYWPWLESVRFGQQDGLILALYAASLYAVARGRSGLAGLALGLSLPIKPVSIWLPLIYLIHGRWRALAGAGVVALALLLVALPWTGIESWRVQLTEQLPDMLPGSVRSTNIPLAALHARFFVERDSLGTGESAPAYLVIRALNAGAALAGLLVLLRLWARLPAAPDAGHSDVQRAWLLDSAIGLLLTVALAPYAWQHYASWLVICFAVLAAPAVWRPMAVRARAGIGMLAGIAFFLLSLEDGKLLRLVAPLVERWPGVMAFYPLGLLCLGAALLTARFSSRTAVCAAT